MWLIAAAYFSAHLLGLLSRGLYWDDWALWQQDKAVVAQAFRSIGSTWPPQYFYAIYYSEWGIVLGRIVTFGSLLASAICLYLVLCALPRVPRRSAFWVAVVFAVFPVFQARVSLVLVTYTLSLMFFGLATLALVRSIERRTAWLRIAAFVLYIISYRTASLLVLSAVIPVIIVVLETRSGTRWRNAARALLRHADMLLAPFAFWLASKTWFRPSGSSYEGYNELIEGVPPADVLALVARGSWHSLWDSLVRAATIPSPAFLAAGALLMTVFVLAASRRTAIRRSPVAVWFTLAGTALLFLAVAPYVMVGKLYEVVPAGAPTRAVVGWETRHQLLVPIGAALLLVGLIELVAGNTRIRRMLASGLMVLLLGVSVAAHVHSYIGYQRHWFKQVALAEQFAKSDEMRSGTTFLVRDESRRLDYDYESGTRFYEYGGIAEEVFGDQTRFIVNEDYFRLVGMEELRPLLTEYYNAADYVEADPDYRMVITQGQPNLRSTGEVIRLTAMDWFDREAVRERVGNAVTVRFEPIP